MSSVISFPLGCSREGTDWEHVLQTLCSYRLLDPGSEWRLHRVWFDQSAMGDLLGEDFSIAAKDTLYRCLDRLLEHKRELFSFLRERWEDLFEAKFDVLLYDLTSTYFESDPPFPEGDKRKFGYPRDKRSDCVQVVIALVITPEGFPLAYEVLAGNTAEKTTLGGFLQKIEDQYGKAGRIWIMDRGIPTEEVLAEMRACDPPIHYLVGTPKGRLSKLEAELLGLDWQLAREGVEVKLLSLTGELYVLARSRERVAKERAMRRRQLKKLWARLAELQRMAPARDTLLLKLGAAKSQYPAAWRLIEVQVAQDGTLGFWLRKDKLREVCRREGRYLLRSNLCAEDPASETHRYRLLLLASLRFPRGHGCGRYLQRHESSTFGLSQRTLLKLGRPAAKRNPRRPLRLTAFLLRSVDERIGYPPAHGRRSQTEASKSRSRLALRRQ